MALPETINGLLLYIGILYWWIGVVIVGLLVCLFVSIFF